MSVDTSRQQAAKRACLQESQGVKLAVTVHKHDMLCTPKQAPGNQCWDCLLLFLGDTRTDVAATPMAPTHTDDDAYRS